MSKKIHLQEFQPLSALFTATLLLSSFIFSRVAGKLFDQIATDSYTNLYPFLEKWVRVSHTKMLTIVFDDYEREHTFDVTQDLAKNLNVSIKLISLKHLIYLKNMNPKRDYQTVDSGSCVLLFFSEFDHLRDILSSPHMVSFWQPENWYILQEHEQRFSDTIKSERFYKWAFERLWRFRRVYKVLFFTENKVIRTDPFDYAGRRAKCYVDTCDWCCEKSNKDIISINEPNATDVSDFFLRRRKDFKMCPLTISIFKTITMTYHEGRYSGLDYKYLEEICKIMNVTPVLINSRDKFGWEENGTFFGTIGHLVYEFADVTFNQFFVKDYLTRHIDFTTPITSDKLCVLVPKALPVPDYLIIFKVFSTGSWALIFSSHLVISMIYTMMKRERSRDMLRNVHRTERDISRGNLSAESYFSDDRQSAAHHIVLGKTKKTEYSPKVYSSETINAVRSRKTTKEEFMERLKGFFIFDLSSLLKYLTEVSLQVMQPYQIRLPWFPERLLLMSSLLLSLILNGVFTSQLASTFSKRMYYKDIDTLEELEESGLAILTNAKDIIEDAFSDGTTPVIRRLHERLQYANDSEVHRRLFQTRDAGYLHRLAPIALNYNEYQRAKLHVVKECPKEYILANIVTKGSPFLGSINNILGRLNNGGFYWKWFKGLYKSQERATELDDGPIHRKIAIRHLFIPFALLYFGLTASVIMFLCERRQQNVG